MAEFFYKTFNLLIALVIVFSIGFYAGLNLAQPQSLKLEKILEEKLSASANIVAVTPQGKGIVNEASVEISQGTGRILLSINPFVEPDTQDSVQTAAGVAERFTGKSLKDKDVVFSIQNSEAKLVGGPSAGSAFALAAIAAIEKKQVSSDSAITGTINSDGSIGQIGGVIEKATAAAEKNFKLFVVPKGQSVITYYEQKQERTQRGNLTIVRTFYIPKTVNLQSYLQDEGFSIQIAEAGNIREAIELMIE